MSHWKQMEGTCDTANVGGPCSRITPLILGNNWTADHGLLSPELAAGIQRVKGVKLLGVRLGRRAELVKVKIEDLDQREEHWVIVNLVGKGGHVRTVPMPQWVKNAIDQWVAFAGIVSIFRQAGLSEMV